MSAIDQSPNSKGSDRVMLTGWLTGFDLGLLIGLSASPVVSGAVTGLLAIVAVLLKPKESTKEQSESKTSEANKPLTEPASADESGKKDLNSNEVEPTEPRVELPKPEKENLSSTEKEDQVVPVSRSSSDIVAWMLPGTIGLPIGLFVGMWIRISSAEVAEKDLKKIYAERGFEPIQVNAIVNHHARSLAGKYRNIREDCEDLGLSPEQTETVVNRLVASELLVPTRHVESQSPLTAGMDKHARRAEPDTHKESDHAASEVDRRAWQVFGGGKANWLDELLDEVNSLPVGAKTETEKELLTKREASIIARAEDYRKILLEAIALNKLAPKTNHSASAIWEKDVEYLDGLLDPKNGDSLQKRKLRIQPTRLQINNMLKAIKKNTLPNNN